MCIICSLQRSCHSSVIHFVNLAVLYDRLYANLHIAKCLAALQRLMVQCLTALQLDDGRSGLLSRAHTQTNLQKPHMHPILVALSEHQLAQHIVTICIFYVGAYCMNHTHIRTDRHNSLGARRLSIVGWSSLS